MFLHSLAHALPSHRFTQLECWERFSRSAARERLSARSVGVMKRVLAGAERDHSRHFWSPDLEALFDLDAEGLNRMFEQAAPSLASEALALALSRAGMDADAVDALHACTCTGYLCPGVTSHVAERLGMREDTYLADLVGLGCGAAVPTLRAAHAFLAANPGATVAVVAVEVCSAAFYLEDDIGVLVSACLFGDGASASLWRSTPPASGPALRLHGFDTVHRPAARESIRFTNAGGKLRNQLHRSVPGSAADAVATLAARRPEAAVDHVISHGGGRDVVDAIEERMPDVRLPWTRDLLRRVGNLSSPSVLVALEDSLRDAPLAPGHSRWLVTFGAGFACHSALLTTE